MSFRGRYPRILTTNYRQGYEVFTGIGNTKYSVHRLVAEVYVPNPLSLKEVNHKDMNKANNHHSNLEWASPKANTNHAWNSGKLSHRMTPVIGINEEGHGLYFRSISESRKMGYADVFKAIKRGGYCGGYLWEYV